MIKFHFTACNAIIGNQHCYYSKFNEIGVCFLLVDLENLQPSGLAIQPSSSDHSQDDRKSVPNSKVGVANKTGVVADEST